MKRYGTEKRLQVDFLHLQKDDNLHHRLFVSRISEKLITDLNLIGQKIRTN